MAFNVKTDIFEGPFELLVHLVSKKKVDIGAISINEIADQYLEEVTRMQSLDLDIASDFLLVASTLLEIKAQALIPRKKDDLEEEIEDFAPNDAYKILVERLIEYKKFKNASEALYGRFCDEAKLHSRPFGPDKCFLNLMPDFLENVTLKKLGTLAAAALARREIFLLESEHIAARPIPVEVHVESIFNRVRTKKHLSFKELISTNNQPALVVVTFLAILELYKRSMVKLYQPHVFGDIEIDYIEGSGELTFDSEDEYYD